MEQTRGNFLKEPLIYKHINPIHQLLRLIVVWETQMEALFDVRVVATDAQSHADISSDKVLENAEK